MSDQKTATQGAADTVTLVDNKTGKSYEFPVLEGTEGPRVIDIGKLYAQTGMFTFDPGYTSTGSCESEITYIDGDKGVLLHRGYPIKELADKSDFMEVCYLCFMATCRTPPRRRSSRRPSPITRCCMSSLSTSSADSAAMPIRWR